MFGSYNAAGKALGITHDGGTKGGDTILSYKKNWEDNNEYII